ncbi:RmlC-like cupin domain-containing protein [Exophiala viscosa]|uniref:RmlC-like cupin domain-containing protein n=1 Tax=Exophiala viscosa TaxID=2486360 RepID=A0AAN6E3N6_9EURO|nr:RmlC-like cupin domain-containing protein [Exophiala viscosa]
MHSTTVLVAAFAAAAYATPMGSGSWGSSSTGYESATWTTTTTSSYASGTGSWGSGSGSYSSSTSASVVPNPSPSSGVVAELLTADSTVSRFKDIQKEIDAGDVNLKFDFNIAANPPPAMPGKGGQVDLANRANFPILTDLGISAAAIFFNPCGLNTPHIHPRASEFLTLATDNNLLTGFVLENGLTTEFNTTLTKFQGTVFPMGSIHFQQNLDCTPAVAIAGLNSEDPGASSIAQNFFALDSEVIDATLGFPKQIDGSNFAAFKKAIPPPLVNGIEECLIRCNISY